MAENKLQQKSRSDQAQWLSDLGVALVQVQLFVKGRWIDERHVADITTLEETVSMSLKRLGGNYAVTPWQGRWALFTVPSGPRRMRLRYYDTREAAEMVAMHRA